MPTAVHPMLATSVEKPFDDPEWLFEIKWDGYRAIAFIAKGKVRLVSRNQNDLTAQYPELHNLAASIKAETAILDGEIAALDEHGRSSFSLMQQRTGIRDGGRRTGISPRYSRALLRLRPALPRRLRPSPGAAGAAQEQCWRNITQCHRRDWPTLFATPITFLQGKALFAVARQKGLEGILAKRRDSYYEERRTQNWLKIKMTQTLDCVIGGYTDPEGSRAVFRIDCAGPV